MHLQEQLNDTTAPLLLQLVLFGVRTQQIVECLHIFTHNFIPSHILHRTREKMVTNWLLGGGGDITQSASRNEHLYFDRRNKRFLSKIIFREEACNFTVLG
jgi:hypothetical protein